VEIYDYHDPNEDHSLPKHEPLSSEYGRVHTPKGPLKVLLVFAQFEVDNVSPTSETWPADQLPNYSEILYTSLSAFNPTNTDLSISNYYYQMSKFSGNPFKLYGEIFPELVKIPIPTTNFSFSHFTNQVFDYIEANYPDYHWNTFDQRDNRPNFTASNVSSSPDDEFDYVVISFRWNGGYDPWGNSNDTTLKTTYEAAWGGSPTGWASIASQTLSTSSGTYRVTNGFTSALGLMSPTGFREFFFHEFGHSMYGAPHYNGANSVVGEHFFTNSGWGMMGSGARHKYCTLGWEQWWLGWNDINYDLNNASQNATYTLYDFITNGDMIRLKIPNTDQYLWIEFHSGQSVFENRASLTVNKQGNPFPENADGVLAYIECISDDKENPGIFTSGANGIKYLHGDGNYEYNHSSKSSIVPEWWPAVYDYYTGDANPFAMQNGVAAIRSDYDSNNKINYNSGTNSPNSGDGNEMHSIVRKNGTMSYDAYGKNMNLKVGSYYSIGSNPAIIEHQNYNEITQELSPIHLHGLRIKVLTQTSSNAQIQVEYDYNKVEQDTRWTGNIELPENQTITIDGADVVIDRSMTPSREYPDADFGFYPYSLFTLKNGSVLNINNGGRLQLNEKSTLTLENGSDISVNSSSITLSSDSKIEIQSGTYSIQNNGTIVLDGTIHLAANTDLTFSGSGRIVLNGAITAEPGASLTIEGVGSTTKLLEVQKSVVFDADFANVILKNGKIVMNNSSAELCFNSGIGNVQVDKVWLTSSTGTRNNHQGMDIRCENFSVTQSTFEHGLYGLYINRVFNAALKPIVSCNFNNNYYGLYTNGGAYQISNCDFINNSNHSLAIYGIVGTTNVSDCYFSGATRGLYINSSGMGAIHVNGTVIENCNIGVYASNQAYLCFKCSSVMNMYSGIELYNNSTIHLASTGTIDAGGNAVSGNNYGIIGNGYPSYNTNNYFFLNNGYNDFSSNGSYALKGNFGAVPGGACNSYNNRWRLDGGAPRNGIEYSLYGTNGEPIFLYDPSPESYFSPCDVLKIAPGEELLKAVSLPDVDTQITRLVSNAIALDDSVNLEKRKSSYRELANVLMRDYKYLSKTEAYSLHLGYQYMKQQLIEMNDIPDFDLYPFIHIMEKVQHKLGSDARAKKHSDVAFIVEYAQTL
jgi:hypothetical protein